MQQLQVQAIAWCWISCFVTQIPGLGSSRKGQGRSGDHHGHGRDDDPEQSGPGGVSASIPHEDSVTLPGPTWSVLLDVPETCQDPTHVSPQPAHLRLLHPGILRAALPAHAHTGCRGQRSPGSKPRSLAHAQGGRAAKGVRRSLVSRKSGCPAAPARFRPLAWLPMGPQAPPPRDGGPAPGDAPRGRPLGLAECTAEGGRARGPAATMKLTRKMVLSRAKASELHNVRKLNCW